MSYLVTKTFTAGALKGLTIVDRTTVSGFVPGKVYKECAGSGAYRVEKVEAVA